MKTVKQLIHLNPATSPMSFSHEMANQEVMKKLLQKQHICQTYQPTK